MYRVDLDRRGAVPERICDQVPDDPVERAGIRGGFQLRIDADLNVLLPVRRDRGDDLLDPLPQIDLLWIDRDRVGVES